MSKTKLWFGEQVLLELNSGLRNRDEKIDIREAILRMDAFVNLGAKEGWLENLGLGFTNSVDDQFVTTFEWLTVTDPANNSPSYFNLPVTSYVSLPNNMGIVALYFQNDFGAAKTKYFDPILVRQWRDISAYRNTLAQSNEGRISVAPKNNQIIFDRGGIFAKYGAVGLQLLVRDASVITDNAPYPVPADKEHEFISSCVDWFRNRKKQMPDLIRDNNDRP